MIVELCNLGHENHIDTFYKIAIIEASQLPYFNHLSKKETVESIITNLSSTATALTAELLYNNINVAHGTSLSGQGKLYPTTISFTLTPQIESLQAVLETYNNTEVVVLVSKHDTAHLYGTNAQPLIFKYDELNSPLPGELKGFTVSVAGSTYGKSLIIDDSDITIYESGLAFELAREI